MFTRPCFPCAQFLSGVAAGATSSVSASSTVFPPRRQGIDSLALNLSAAVQAKDYEKSAPALEEQIRQYFVEMFEQICFVLLPSTSHPPDYVAGAPQGVDQLLLSDQ